jgi:hypothetical protein
MFVLQQNAIKKFCKDEDYEVVVIDNSSDGQLSEDLRYHAGQRGVKYFRIFSGAAGGSDSHAFAANFAYSKLKEEYEYFFHIDHDCIPVRDFSVKQILSGGHVMAGLGQARHKTYFWPGCVMWKNDALDKTLIDFSPLEGLDTGGSLCRVVDKYGEGHCIFFNETYHQNPHFNGKENFYAMINDRMFLHFINGSNWKNDSRHQERINSLINTTKEVAGL